MLVCCVWLWFLHRRNVFVYCGVQPIGCTNYVDFFSLLLGLKFSPFSTTCLGVVSRKAGVKAGSRTVRVSEAWRQERRSYGGSPSWRLLVRERAVLTMKVWVVLQPCSSFWGGGGNNIMHTLVTTFQFSFIHIMNNHLVHCFWKHNDIQILGSNTIS